MSNTLDQIQGIVSKLSTRERILVLLGILSIIYVLWDTFLIASIQKTNKNLMNERSSIQEQLNKLQIRSTLANGLLKNSNRKQILSEIHVVEKEIKNFDNKISDRLQGRVAPEYMASLLNDVLQNNENLELISIHNLPAVPFVSHKKDNKKDDESLLQEQKEKPLEAKQIGIFMHPLEIQLQGRYIDVLNYLLALEKMEWKVFWDQVKLDVLEYPNVKVKIKVHTFSLKDGWLSV